MRTKAEGRLADMQLCVHALRVSPRQQQAGRRGRGEGTARLGRIRENGPTSGRSLLPAAAGILPATRAAGMHEYLRVFVD